MPNFSEIMVHFVEKKPSMFTFMFLFFTHEKSKALMFFSSEVKGFDVLIFSSFKAFMFLFGHVLIKKKSVLAHFMFSLFDEKSIKKYIFVTNTNECEFSIIASINIFYSVFERCPINVYKPSQLWNIKCEINNYFLLSRYMSPL